MIQDGSTEAEDGSGGFTSSSVAAWLIPRKLRPSAILERIFLEAAKLEYGPQMVELLVTTERLLFAVADLGTAASEVSIEAQALGRVSLMLTTDRERYLGIRQKYLGAPAEAGEGSSSKTRFSQNVARALELAGQRARERRPDAGDLTVLDFLATFPPEGSVAFRLLADLGLRQEDIRRAVEDVESQQEPAGETAGPDPIPETEASPPDAKLFNDSVATHADEPALIDQLERLPFAAVLARNIREARASGESEASAFVVHLHGPWGSGKSSVLNFLEAELKKEKPPWLVVRFNAWRDQRRQPPWWSLITCIYASACKKLDKQTSKRLWWRWFKWRVRADFLPWVVTGALVLVFAALLILGVTSSIGPTVSAIGGTLTLVGAGAVAVRSLALGSQRAAQTYADLKADPFQPMTTLFDRLIKAIGRPVAVFIDDLDRCDSGYVVELLEGIQTLMRSAPVTYVVAADRKWICSSFEQRYAKFSPPIGEPGRPLGYLFLDKMFQVSAAVPQLATDIRSSYWQSLLSVSGKPPESAQGRKAAEDARWAADEEAKAQLADLTTHEELRGAVERAEESMDPLVIQATRAEAAMRISSAEASVEAEHRLKDYSHLLEPNPRSMKRLVNAYGMHQATLFLAGRSASPDALARWTILELRWPLLADFLAVRPNYVDRLRAPLAAEELKHVPDALRGLFGDELIVEVVGEGSAHERLDPDALRAILGAVQGDR